jgi:ACS family hexuronate transporter-like MFS transporter
MKMSGLRWWIVGLVAIATVINYIDRGTLGYLWGDISTDIWPQGSGESEEDYETRRKEYYATISVVFVFSYALGQTIFGKLFDWIGTRLGFVLSIGVWSLATAAHALANGVASLAVVRSILGVAEAGNWPGATKANAEWFPVNERALAQGIFNSGAAIGGIVSPLLIAFLSVYFSWQMIFIIVGFAGLVWLVPWWILMKSGPEAHPWITPSEREFILTGQKADFDGDGTEEVAGYNPTTGEMLSRKESWGAILSAAFIDPIWWLFVFWIPIYLGEVYGFDVKEIGLYAWVPYVGAMFGAWFGGLLAQNRIKSGWSVNATRKLTITLGGIIMLPCLLAMTAPGSPTVAVLLMAVILFGFQTAVGNIQTLPSDFYGGKSVGSLAGYAGTAAKLTAAGLTYLIPWLTQGGNYAPAFIIGAALAVLGVASVWLLCGEIKPLKPRHAEKV